jgi:outer membrane protein TolC
VEACPLLHEWRHHDLIFGPGQYVQTALNAFRDVSDSLISLEKFDAVRAELIAAVEPNELAVRIATSRYLEGLSTYKI